MKILQLIRAFVIRLVKFAVCDDRTCTKKHGNSRHGNCTSIDKERLLEKTMILGIDKKTDLILNIDSKLDKMIKTVYEMKKSGF